jgi:hypothetical protein
MRIPHEQRPIDVTRLPPRQEITPPLPPVVRTQRLGTTLGAVISAALPALELWLHRPLTRFILFALAAGLTVGVVLTRSRPTAIDGPALARTGWHASASGGGKARRHAPDPVAALDGSLDTSWTTGRGQRNSDWFAVDMGKAQKFHQVVLDSGKNADEYPRSYAVYVSGDDIHWGRSIASGDGRGPLTVAGFAPQTARYIKVVQTGQDRHSPWCICEFTVH